jgi:hypothetical protein
MDATILKGSLRAGAVYFTCVALAHTAGVKIPGLFIYYNVPSHVYQDQIIAFLAFGWAAFFYAAADDPLNHPLPVKAILVAGAAAILGLCRINAFSDLSTLAPGSATAPFWMQTLLLLGYLIWLFVFYRRARSRAALPR